MKKYLTLVAVLSAAITFSCQQEVPYDVSRTPEDPEVPVFVVDSVEPEFHATFEEGETKAGFNYNSGARTYSHFWEIGDELAIFPKNNSGKRYTCSDPASGTFTFASNSNDPNTYSYTYNYAVYPKSLPIGFGGQNDPEMTWLLEADYGTSIPITSACVINVEVPAQESFAPDANTLGYGNIMVARSEDENLVFKNCLGWLKIQLVGNALVKRIQVTGKNSEVLSGAGSISFDVSGNPVLAMNTKCSAVGYYKRINITSPYLSLDSSTPTEFYVPLPPVTFSSGFTLTITYENGLTEELSTDKEITITRNTVTPMAVIGGAPVNLSAAATANCYIATNTVLSRRFLFSPVKVDGSSVGTIDHVGVLWETDNTTTAVSTGDIITDVAYTDGNITFALPLNNKQGNALIAAYDSENTILWSWHIWRLNSEPAVKDFRSGKIQDRNLGALSSNPGDERLTWGFVYQYGRKDPFMGSPKPETTTTPHYYAAAGTYSPSDIAYYTESFSESYERQHPTVFMARKDSEPLSAGSIWRSPGWERAKTNVDPCPPGYVVPTGGENVVQLMNYVQPAQIAIEDYAYWYDVYASYDDVNKGWMIHSNWHPVMVTGSAGINVGPTGECVGGSHLWLNRRNACKATVRLRIGSFNYSDAFCSHTNDYDAHNLTAYPLRCEKITW